MSITPLSQFQDSPTPKNAIELAIADHHAFNHSTSPNRKTSAPDYDFIGALLKARAMIDHRDQVITSLTEIISWLTEDLRIAKLHRDAKAVRSLENIIRRATAVINQDL